MKVDVKDSPQGTTALTSSVGHTKLSIIEMRKKRHFSIIPYSLMIPVPQMFQPSVKDVPEVNSTKYKYIIQ